MRFGASHVRLFAQHIKHSYSLLGSAWRVIPRNYLLFACHATNATAQLTQDARFVNYWYMGGREKKLAAPVVSTEVDQGSQSKVLEAVNAVQREVKAVEEKGSK